MGSYDIELLTLPRTYLNDVKIRQGKLNEIDIPAPGRLNIAYSSKGVGSLYQLDDQGIQRLIKRIDPDGGKISFGIQPGNYKLVYRSDKALGSKYTQIKTFSITSGATQTIRIY
jgi:Ca-activated chloride channel family protein